MEKLRNYIKNNSIISPYSKQINIVENVAFFQATIYLNFNNCYYKESITDLSFNKNNYEQRLINILINKIIYELGKIKLNDIFNN